MIRDNAFASCTSLKEIAFVEGVKSIGSRVLDGCEKLETVILPKSLEKIGASAFSNCAALKTIGYLGNKDEWEKLRRESSGWGEGVFQAQSKVKYSYKWPS